MCASRVAAHGHTRAHAHQRAGDAGAPAAPATSGWGRWGARRGAQGAPGAAAAIVANNDVDEALVDLIVHSVLSFSPSRYFLPDEVPTNCLHADCD